MHAIANCKCIPAPSLSFDCHILLRICFSFMVTLSTGQSRNMPDLSVGFCRCDVQFIVSELNAQHMVHNDHNQMGLVQTGYGRLVL